MPPIDDPSALQLDPEPPSVRASAATTTSPTTALPGRVVRLNFYCIAELPIGSTLRVTGSTLWAPGTLAHDPSDAAAVYAHEQAQGFTTNTPSPDDTVMVMDESEHANVLTACAGSGAGGGRPLYASSIEMVTTPETYPVWKTRRPVILVVHAHDNHNKGGNTSSSNLSAPPRRRIQHHYYRYLVVCPGAAAENVLEQPADLLMEDVSLGNLISTSNEEFGSTPVMQWEDPFSSILSSTSLADARANSIAEASAVSMASSLFGTTSSNANGATAKDYRNLPYRTLDIDLATNQPLWDDGTGSGDEENGVHMDHWNVADDVTFRPYRIREVIHQENRRKLLTRSVSSVVGDDTDMATDRLEDEDRILSSSNIMASGDATPVFSASSRIFFVCYHLPVVVAQDPITKDWRASWSESILARTEGSRILAMYESYWVGTVTTYPPLETAEDKDAVSKLLKEMNCVPIFLDTAIRQAHYYGFCKQVLWPAFHNIDLLDLSTSGWLSDPNGNGHDADSSTSGTAPASSDWDQSRLEHWWLAYNATNAEFCRVLANYFRPGDILWIHDYHLSILPKMLHSIETETYGKCVTRKVFFLHIPFPTSQIFRELECGESLLQGMLHADVVGFHAFDHARHFLNAAKRILGLNYESIAGGLIGVNFQGKTVLVSMSNVSIEPRMVDVALMLPTVAEGKKASKKKHDGRIIIGGVDIGQRLSGVALKFLAYERLLQDYPVWQSKVVMVQRVLLPGSRKVDEKATIAELRAIVKRLTDKFGSKVIDYEESAGSSLPLDQRLALWKSSDILMCTPIREGLNHWPLEFIYAHKAPESPGVVIMSEFSAVSSILNGALRVNPFDIQMSIITIDKALSMELQEREGRRFRDIDFVQGSPSDRWVKNVLRDLRDATCRQSAANQSETNSQSQTPYGTPNPKSQALIDSTAAFLSRESNAAFVHLSMSTLQRAYNATKRRVIFTDFNGTIVMKEPPGKYLKREILGSSGNKPPPAVIEALQQLVEDPRNTVYVVSGDSSENVLSALGHIPKLGLAVSNGGRYSPPISPEQPQRRWLTFDLGVDWDAVKRVALPILSKYTARSNGSFVKLTSFSIGWSYYSCDPEWGSLQSAHLVLELENELRAFDVRFVTLKGIVEIVPRKLNKGLIVKRVLREVAAQHPEGVDFILCMGDDISDEKMFTSVFSYIAELGDSFRTAGPPVVRDDGTFEPPVPDNSVVPDPLFAYTVAVGKKSSHASTYVNSATNVANALVLLASGQAPDEGIWDHHTTEHLFG
ncbi:hypothetical protein MPSEU_000582300 [Mayamaea pseudoterrestris]|nr:hypothetical protein MPSEU_000582300 [Mayamaea pseudoterrestris]